MKKALAISLATVATVGGTMTSAPAEAGGRGIGPGLAFGLAAGAITAGAVAASGAYGPMGRAMATSRNLPITVRDRTPITADRITSATTIGGITGNDKARKHRSGPFFWCGCRFSRGLLRPRRESIPCIAQRRGVVFVALALEFLLHCLEAGRVRRFLRARARGVLLFSSLPIPLFKSAITSSSLSVFDCRA